MAGISVVEGEDEFAWLTQGTPFNWGGGAWRADYPHSVMILHAMWRDPGRPSDKTHNQVEKELLSQGLLDMGSRHPIEQDLVTSTTLASVGMPESPERDLERVLWRDYAAQHRGTGAFGREWVPARALTEARQAFPLMEASVYGPGPGRLDAPQWRALLSILRECRGDVDVYRFCATDCWYGPTDTPFAMPLAFGKLSDFEAECDDADASNGLGNNLWPADHSWLVYTDIDSPQTIVSGDIDLIEAVKSHPDFEAVDIDMEPYLKSFHEIHGQPQ